MIHFRPAVFVVIVVMLCFAVGVDAGLYKWTDEDGNLHVATSLEDVPKKYRDQVTTIGDEPGSPPPAAPASVPRVEADDGSAAEAVESNELPGFEVPYENEGSTQRVIIEVTFNDRVTAPMALDTGSPGMVISVDLAERLLIFDRDSGILFTEASGIGGSALAVRTIVDSVSVGTARNEFVPTTVIAWLSTEFDGLIGMDFLANHTISIDSRNRVVVFQEVPPQPGARAGRGEDWWRKTFEDFRTVRDVWEELAENTNLREESRYRRAMEFQAREAARLFRRLENYASDNAVPRHWR